LRSILVCAEALFVITLASFTKADSSQFDGTWKVTLTCPSYTESSGAQGYIFEFDAHVKDGMLAGQFEVEGRPNSVKITGHIQPNGSATLHAAGWTGDPNYAVKHPPKGTIYEYDIKAQFNSSQGVGSRLQTRKCDLVFNKQKGLLQAAPLLLRKLIP
jgi:hypothetical protein